LAVAPRKWVAKRTFARLGDRADSARTTIDHGWREVAETALTFIKRFT
jgi:hypothetical protein